jgi:ABC-type microcin C transport system permease subunit YejB
VESSFWSLVLLLVLADMLFGSLLVITNGGSGYYGWFNLQNIWSMCFRCLLLPAVVEHTMLLLICDRHVCGVFC